MHSVVSVRGQTAIPKGLREALKILPGTKLSWIVKERSVLVFAILDDPVGALSGILKEPGYTYSDFMRERNEERAREHENDNV